MIVDDRISIIASGMFAIVFFFTWFQLTWMIGHCLVIGILRLLCRTVSVTICRLVWLCGMMMQMWKLPWMENHLLPTNSRILYGYLCGMSTADSPWMISEWRIQSVVQLIVILSWKLPSTTQRSSRVYFLPFHRLHQEILCWFLQNSIKTFSEYQSWKGSAAIKPERLKAVQGNIQMHPIHFLANESSKSFKEQLASQDLYQ